MFSFCLSINDDFFLDEFFKQSTGCHLWMPYVKFKVWKVCWWMGAYGSPTPKRQYAYSCSKAILRLDVGWKRKFAAPASVKTVKQYKNKKGQSRYVGTQHVRGTEFLVYFYFQVWE